MRPRTRLILNTQINVTARFVTVATRFVITPFAIGVLGRESFGVWIVVGQIFGYTALLELGLRSAISRRVAVGLHSDERRDVLRYINTAGGYYALCGLLVAALTFFVSWHYPRWFDVAPELHTASRIMVLASGLTLACTLPQHAYSAVLAGLERFDIVAGTAIAADLMRMVLILALLAHVDIGDGLILLAAASGGTVLVGALTRTVASLRLFQPLRFAPWRMEMRLLGPLMAFGLSTVVFLMSATVILQFAQIILGAMVGAKSAADFNVAAVLVLGMHAFVISFGQGTRVAASRYDGAGDAKMLRHLLLRSARYSGYFAITGATLLWIFGDTFFRLWVGKSYGGAEGQAALQAISGASRFLLVGYACLWLQVPAYSVLNGMGRHLAPAIMGAAAACVSMLMVVWFASRADVAVDRIGLGVVLPMIPIWCVLMPLHCCRQLAMPLFSYVKEAFIVPVLGCMPVWVLAYFVNSHGPAVHWFSFAAQIGTCGLAVLIVGWFGVLKRNDRTPIIDGVMRRVRGTG